MRELRTHNSFDSLRLLFAIAVLYSHSYAISSGDACDALCANSIESYNLASLGLSGFFVISGFLIANSIGLGKTLLQFITARILRIMPALIIALVVTIVLAGLSTEQGLQPFLSKTSTLTYLVNGILFYKLDFELPGVFPNNPLAGEVNGSLWSLYFEVCCYVVACSLFFTRKSIFWQRTLSLVIAALAGFHYYVGRDLFPGSTFFPNTQLLAYGFANFFVGVFLSTFSEAQFRSKKLTTVLFVLLVLSLVSGHFYYVQFVILPLLTVFAAHSLLWKNFSIKEKLGDTSYGLFLIHFPLMQALMQWHSLSQTTLFLSALLISLLYGFCSWRFIERPVLGLQPRLFRFS